MSTTFIRRPEGRFTVLHFQAVILQPNPTGVTGRHVCANASDDPSRNIDLLLRGEFFRMSFILFFCCCCFDSTVNFPVVPAVHGRHCMGERCRLHGYRLWKKRESNRVYSMVCCGCEQSAPTWRAWAENPWPLHTPVWNSHSAVDQAGLV